MLSSLAALKLQLIARKSTEFDDTRITETDMQPIRAFCLAELLPLCPGQDFIPNSIWDREWLWWWHERELQAARHSKCLPRPIP